MTPTTLDAKPQCAQLIGAHWHVFGGQRFMIEADVIERIEKLERALAEARRERDESIRAHKDMTHEASRIGMLHLDNHLGDVYHAMQNLRVGYGAKRSGRFVQDAAHQPEKDANNGNR